jgi:hypothetical protein
MPPIYVIVAALVLAATPAAVAQEGSPRLAVPRENADPPDSDSAAPQRRAVPRSEAPQRGEEPERTSPPPRQAPPRAEPTRIPPTRIEPGPGAGAAAPPEQGQAVPRGSRPQGDNPRTGTAVPRGTRPPPAPPGHADGRSRDRGRTVIVQPPVYRNYYYYYPRRYYPYGYGAFGLGYFYYDPYTWYSDPYRYPGGYYPYAYYQRHSGWGFDIGEVRLRVTPRNAQVFVDGYYAGVVDDYDGAFQGLKLESGPYRIEIVAPGYEPLEFDIRIQPGQKITYRGDLRRLP